MAERALATRQVYPAAASLPVASVSAKSTSLRIHGDDCVSAGKSLHSQSRIQRARSFAWWLSTSSGHSSSTGLVLDDAKHEIHFSSFASTGFSTTYKQHGTASELKQTKRLPMQGYHTCPGSAGAEDPAHHLGRHWMAARHWRTPSLADLIMSGQTCPCNVPHQERTPSPVEGALGLGIQPVIQSSAGWQ